MLLALDICVNKKTPPTHSVNWVLKPSPPQKHDPIFYQVSSKIYKLSKPPFLGNSHPLPSKKIFHACPSLQKKIRFFSELP